MERLPLSEQEAQSWDAAFERPTSRAPAAIAVATLVMGAGALFLASFHDDEQAQSLTTASSTVAETPIMDTETAEADTEKAAPKIARDAGETPYDAVVETKAPEAPPLASLTEAPTTPAAKFAPSLKPKRQQDVIAVAAKKVPSPRGFWPVLKPTLTASLKAVAAKSVVAPAQRPMSFGGFAIADNNDNPPAVFFQSDVTPNRTPPPPLAVALSTDVETRPSQTSIKLARGETFVDALKRAGVGAEDRNRAAAAFGKVQNLRKLRPGQEFVLVTAPANQTVFQLAYADAKPALHLLDLDFRIDAQNKINLARNPSGEFKAVKSSVPLTTRLASIEGRIEGSLFLSAKKAGAPSQVIGNFANMFAYDVDFQRDIFGGDEFEAIFEVHYDDEGRIVGAGDILYGRLKWRGRSKEKGYYRFASANGGSKADFFDRAGQSAKRLLMKTPIDGARLSSGFGTRKHPILGYRKAHKGVDFAARRGTPIYAAGDGVVERANRFGSFGNYVRIRHANGYKTAYAHLKGFRKGIRAGKRVEQGDIIGYVGTTGRSTGPHLHYEVHYKGKAVNPQRLKIATGVQLKGAEIEKFKAVRDEIDLMRAPPPAPDALYAEEEAANRKSL